MKKIIGSLLAIALSISGSATAYELSIFCQEAGHSLQGFDPLGTLIDIDKAALHQAFFQGPVRINEGISRASAHSNFVKGAPFYFTAHFNQPEWIKQRNQSSTTHGQPIVAEINNPNMIQKITDLVASTHIVETWLRTENRLVYLHISHGLHNHYMTFDPLKGPYFVHLNSWFDDYSFAHYGKNHNAFTRDNDGSTLIFGDTMMWAIRRNNGYNCVVSFPVPPAVVTVTPIGTQI